MERKDYTIKVFKFDKRCKTGEKFMARYEYCNKTDDEMLAEIMDLTSKLYPASKFRFELHETWVTRVNMMSGKEYKERFDTPHYCSPSNESYWSM
jgi:hypothetical protein